MDKVVFIAYTFIAAAVNFICNFYSQSFFNDAYICNEFMVLYSYALLGSSLFANVLIFKDRNNNTLYLGLVELAIVIGFLFCMVPYNLSVFGMLLFCFLSLKEVLRISGNYNNFIPNIWQCVSIFGLIAVQMFILSGFLTANGFLSLLLIFIAIATCTLFSNMPQLSFDFNLLKARSAIKIAFADFAPIFSAYIIYIYSFEILNEYDFASLRKSLAFGGVSSLIGSVSLIYFLRTAGDSVKLLPKLAYVTPLLLLGLFFFDDSWAIYITVAVVFSLSSVLHSANRVYLPSNQYVMLSTYGALVLSLFLLINSTSAQFFISSIVALQISHIILSATRIAKYV